MIAFASLFLGLMVGVRPVTVIAGEPVASVIFELDDRSVGRLTGRPWTLDVDFGKEFAPHELVARAYDEKGEEIGLARQWINLPRPPAEVEVVLERDGSGRAVGARLAWESILGVKPLRIVVTFDGARLPLSDRSVVFPAYDPEATHVLTAVLDFPNGVRSRSDVVLGGGSTGEAKSELTAVPILTDGKPPRPETLRGKFRTSNQTLSVAAVEHGPAEIVVVRDLSSAEALRAFRRGRALGGAMPFFSDGSALEGHDVARILWPIARRIVERGTSNELFETSHEFSGKAASFRFLLTQVDYPGASGSPRRFADAVAVAGLRACGSYSRRAVVLVLGNSGPDQSLYQAAAVRRYLERLRVPLYVWTLVPPGTNPPALAPWGDAEDVSSWPALERAVQRLRRDLERQSIVWLEGRHLPQQIELAGEDGGLELAG
jgi:hypothetical protein